MKYRFLFRSGANVNNVSSVLSFRENYRPSVPLIGTGSVQGENVMFSTVLSVAY